MKTLLFLAIIVSKCQNPNEMHKIPIPIAKTVDVVSSSQRRDTEPKVNPNDKLFSKTLSTYRTKFLFEEKNVSRAKNIGLAASKLNGIEISPGLRFSFNETVGKRSKEEGFQEATVIFASEKTEGMGGGVCQVSSTLYAASMFAGMNVTNRVSHSRPSTYISKGLDSTVDYDTNIDLAFTNPYDFPIKIVAGIPESGTIEISFMGSEIIYNAKHYFKNQAAIPFEQRIIRGPYRHGPPKKKQRGEDGMPGLSFWYYKSNNEKYKDKFVQTESRYKSVPEVWYANTDEIPSLKVNSNGI